MHPKTYLLLIMFMESQSSQGTFGLPASASWMLEINMCIITKQLFIEYIFINILTQRYIKCHLCPFI